MASSYYEAKYYTVSPDFTLRLESESEQDDKEIPRTTTKNYRNNQREATPKPGNEMYLDDNVCRSKRKQCPRKMNVV